MSIYIEDGYTLTKTIEAVPGLHPEVVFTYRAAPGIERNRYSEARGADAVTKFEDELIKKYTVDVNGQPLDPRGQIKPTLRVHFMNLILGYAGSDTHKADVKN